MIVIRAFEVLDGLCLQFTTHVFCCGSGTCPEPESVRYETRPYDPDQGDEVVREVVSIVHDVLSETGDALVSAFLQNHPATHLAH